MKNIFGILIIVSLFLSCTSNLDNKNEQKVNLSQEQIDSIAMIECDSLIKRLHKRKLDTIGKSDYKPKNFNECLLQLDTLINDSLKQWIICLPDGRFGNIVHHSFGMYLRNNWGLWGETELAKNLYEMGIFHPDDMSAIILDSYQRKLKGEELKLEEQLKYYQDFWRESGTPIDSLLEEIRKNKE